MPEKNADIRNNDFFKLNTADQWPSNRQSFGISANTLEQFFQQMRVVKTEQNVHSTTRYKKLGKLRKLGKIKKEKKKRKKASTEYRTAAAVELSP